MAMSICNIRQSIAWMLLMFVLSSVQGQPVVDLSPSVAYCSVERLESQVISFEDRLNNLQRIVSTVYNHLIKVNCTVDLASYGYDDSVKYGYIRTSGGSSLEIYVPRKIDRYRGVNLVKLDLATCTVRDWQRFDTHSYPADRVRLLETLESATAGTIIVGVTADTPEHEDNVGFKNITAAVFRRYGMTLNRQLYREKFAFIIKKGYPEKTIFREKSRYGESLRMSVAIRGLIASDVTFDQV